MVKLASCRLDWSAHQVILHLRAEVGDSLMLSEDPPINIENTIFNKSMIHAGFNVRVDRSVVVAGQEPIIRLNRNYVVIQDMAKVPF